MKPCLSLVLALLCAGAGAGGAEVVDLGAQTQQIFAVRCTQCHGPQLAKPRGKFGYVTDLRRVAANPDLVVSFNPSASKLWQDIDDHDMPPRNATAGPLSEPEKSIVRAWIDAGAPKPLHAGTQPVEAVLANERTREPSTMSRALRLLGKLHVPIVHFPIALLIAAAAGDLWFAWRGRPAIHEVVRFCVALGAAAAVLGAALGWVHAA